MRLEQRKVRRLHGQLQLPRLHSFVRLHFHGLDLSMTAPCQLCVDSHLFCCPCATCVPPFPSSWCFLSVSQTSSSSECLLLSHQSSPHCASAYPGSASPCLRPSHLALQPDSA